jgi:hypothetical protein
MFDKAHREGTSCEASAIPQRNSGSSKLAVSVASEGWYSISATLRSDLTPLYATSLLR